MAKSSILFSSIFIVSFLLLVCIGESRTLTLGVEHGMFQTNQITVTCDTVFGVRSADTCAGITQLFNLSSDSFQSLNPNLNCDHLFVGQWICVVGSV